MRFCRYKLILQGNECPRKPSIKYVFTLQYSIAGTDTFIKNFDRIWKLWLFMDAREWNTKACAGKTSDKA